MRKEDFKEFAQMLDAVCGLLSRGAYTPNAQNTALFFRSLARYELETVRAAFDGHVCDPVRGKFVPVPADILAQIESRAQNDGRPDAEEAWALSVCARDEGATVVWTDEMAEAYGICLPVLNGGDEVGARMAFKSAYARLVDLARAGGKPAKWSASLGHNKLEQTATLTRHAQLGRVPFPALESSSPIGLLELAQSPDAPEQARQALMRVRERLLERSSGPSAAEVDALRTSALKAASAELVKQHMGAQ